MDATAVVTGASRGIGAAVARALGAEGARVMVAAREADAVESVAESITEAGGEARAMRADVRDEYDVERLMETAARFGDGVDYVVANAGVYHGKPTETPIDRESYSAFDDHLRTNARGVFAAIREALPHMPADGRAVVPTGSVARDAVDGMGSYAVSKAAAEAVARQFAADVDRTVGCLDPGSVDTDLSGPGGRDPGDVAEMFLWAYGVDAEELDGEVLTLRDWKTATR
ncbi:short-chain dehydrogenase [Halobacteriales archaeon QS_8_69_26]|nr:MAG: short-chain dehydrogenase [Halobacteriales archaeon QS_8_69_26]